MPLNIHGADKGVRIVRRQVRALPLLDGILQRLGVPVSVVPGTVRRSQPAAARITGFGSQTGMGDDPLMFARLDVSPALCAAEDGGEPGMGLRSCLAGATADLLSRHIPAALRDEALAIVLADGRRMMAVVRARAGIPDPAAAAILASNLNGADWERRIFTGQGARTMFRDGAPDAPAPHVWPDYWRTAFQTVWADEHRAARADGQPLSRTVIDRAVSACVVAHMPYEGEMLSDDPRWSLPRRLLNGAADAAQACARARAEAFSQVLGAINAVPASGSEAVRRGLAEARHSGIPELREAASLLQDNIFEFGSDSDGIEAVKLAAPAMAELEARLGGRDAAMAAARDACLHIVHVTAMTKTCFPSTAAQRAELMRTIAERPWIGSTVSDMADDGWGHRMRMASAPARHGRDACYFFSFVQRRARDTVLMPRRGAIDAIRDTIICFETMPQEGQNRKAVDLWHSMLSGYASILSFPAAWHDIEAGTLDRIAGFGRTGDREAFMAAAAALRAGLDHRLAIEAAAAFTPAQKLALGDAGAAFGRICTALEAGTGDTGRFRTMAQDLAILGRESAALGQQIGQPIANRVTRRLVQEFGARSRSGALTRANDRCLLADARAGRNRHSRPIVTAT
jgi:hypothetical protein